MADFCGDPLTYQNGNKNGDQNQGYLGPGQHIQRGLQLESDTTRAHQTQYGGFPYVDVPTEDGNTGESGKDLEERSAFRDRSGKTGGEVEVFKGHRTKAFILEGDFFLTGQHPVFQCTVGLIGR